MFDDLIDIFSGRDLVTPLVSFFQDILNGPYCTFIVPTLAGWTKREIRHILTEHGVDTWGMIRYADEIHFAVREKQAVLARDALITAGVPILRCPELAERCG